ncbi:hypothetical protein M0R45_008761 [Rubus argutus]|uniref:Uncharacterized protein n=1 Tax=Rubus argutus TaxID=59490 RepID=A0AAW1Y5Y9_RUBAR
MDLTEQRAEVWDNHPDSDSELRCLEYASAAIGILQIIFANEMTKAHDVYFHFPSFTVTIPDPNPTVGNNHDSGIYVIRHMQYYRRKWFRGFNYEDQRIRLALEIVNHPRNKINPSVVAAACRHNQAAIDDQAKKIGDKGGCAFKNAGQIYQQTQPKHVPALPTGRKLLSHRKRRSRP